MNGNDYLEIEQEHAQEIFEDYIDYLRKGNEITPEEFTIMWIDRHLESE